VSQEGTLRVISGRFRGRKLGAAPPGVRPTSDRVRESVFARLGSPPGVRVLDLFAGSGALGIEAISRGAKSLVSVERSGRVVAALQRSLEKLGIEEGVRVLRMDARGAIRHLAGRGDRFDLVFADPPYDAVDEAEKVLALLAQSGLLTPDAVVVVECSKRHPVPPIPGLVEEDERIYGDTLVRWLVPEDPTQATGGSTRP